MHLRVLRVSVVNKVLEFFLSLASHNSSGLLRFKIIKGIIGSRGVLA